LIKIICVGKVKEKYLNDAISEYKKRLSKYTNLKIVEVDDYGIENSIVSLKKEKELIKSKITSKDYIIVLKIDGLMLSSPEFSKKIDDIMTHNSNITFIIGGSYGLDDEIISMADLSLSFSKMTFPHQLFRVFLLEQIYRAFKIKNNEKYHK